VNNLQVVACANNLKDNLNDDSPSRLSESKIGFWKFILSPNPRRDDPPLDIQHTTIVNTKIPSDVDPKDDKSLFHYITERCYIKITNLHYPSCRWKTRLILSNQPLHHTSCPKSSKRTSITIPGVFNEF